VATILPTTLPHQKLTIMKTLNTLCLTLLIVGSLLTFNLKAHTTPVKTTITVLNIDTKGLSLDPQQMGNIVRIELEKLDTFDVTDRYDVVYLVDKNKLNIANCYGKLCLLEVGNTINTDYMFTGSVELYSQTIITTFRLINVKTGIVERTSVDEYLNFPQEAQQMVNVSIRKMFGLTNNEELVLRLTKKFDYENSINNPDKSRLNLQGPSFGYTFLFGPEATILGKSTSEGGYNAYPAMFQFGYQFEKQYLNEGNYQALFEFIPMITGVDQQLVIPSLTILNGFRNNKHGWEIAIGPTMSIGTFSDMANINGKYYTENQLKEAGITDYELKKTMDSRGKEEVTSALIVAFGKTFKSGRMNIPVNLWATIPTQQGFRLGISVGYNSKK
jgi:hypothetical protein